VPRDVNEEVQVKSAGNAGTFSVDFMRQLEPLARRWFIDYYE
jgi:hypothetical protein